MLPIQSPALPLLITGDRTGREQQMLRVQDVVQTGQVVGQRRPVRSSEQSSHRVGDVPRLLRRQAASRLPLLQSHVQQIGRELWLAATAAGSRQADGQQAEQSGVNARIPERSASHGNLTTWKRSRSVLG